MSKMHRYLKKYVGTYRVLARYDLDSEDFPRNDQGVIDEEYDELYIPVARHGEIRACADIVRGKDILCLYYPSGEIGRNTYKALKEAYPDIWLEVNDFEYDMRYDFWIRFDAIDIEKIAEIVKPRTSGAKIPPYSLKNLPKIPYEIPAEDNQQLLDIMEGMDLTAKMQFMRTALKNFTVDKHLGEKIAKTKLKGKQAIHSLGLWREFVDYCKELKQTA